MGDPMSEPRTATLTAPPVVRRSPKRCRRARRRIWRRQFFDTRPIDVSVCIANWNCRDLLRECLRSLHDRPQGVCLETIVVDNASVDGAAAMVEEEFPEVILVRNDCNAGFSRANNQAARRARGRYLFFLNNDTVVPPGTLRRLVEYANAHPKVGIVGPLLRGGDGEPQVSYRLRPTPATLLHRTTLLRWTGLLRRGYQRYRRLDFDTKTTRPVEVLMGAAMLIPRVVFDRCGGWDEEFTFGGEDIELSARVGRDHTLIYHPAVEITHYGRVSTRQHIGFASAQMALGFLRYLRKSASPGISCCSTSCSSRWMHRCRGWKRAVSTCGGACAVGLRKPSVVSWPAKGMRIF